MAEKTGIIHQVATLQHKAEHTFMLGCPGCPDRSFCGGLQIQSPELSCLDNCPCVGPARCGLVCPRNPTSFAKRVAEVNGFDLGNIAKRSSLPFPRIPDLISQLYRSLPLARPVDLDLVAIPFSEMYRRRGKLAMPYTRSELEAKFRLGPHTKIALSGVEQDEHVEQWWGSVGRRDVVRILLDLGVIFATTPNFSLTVNAPRHDDLHAMKRIALVWSQLHDAGVPTALHVNGRTDHDFFRLREFLQFHTEIEAIAFEFTTGAAKKERGQYFAELLIRLAGDLARPLTLIVRGGVAWASLLAPHFGQIVLLETDAFHKTVNRKRAALTPSGRLHWQHNPTAEGAPLDELLAHNLAVMSVWVRHRRELGGFPRTARPITQTSATSQSDAQGHNESPQLGLL